MSDLVINTFKITIFNKAYSVRFKAKTINMNLYGLIGYPLGHSFSKGYFTEKFQQLGIADTHTYEKFELENIQDFPTLLKSNSPQLKGLNVTIPHKQNVIPFWML